MEVSKVSYRSWKVESDSGKDYFVTWGSKGWWCNCFGFSVHMRECKHIKEVKRLLKNNLRGGGE